MPGFSRIFFSYTLSMIPDWEKALAQAVVWLQPGGELHLVDFGGQERLPRWFRGGLRQWLTMFHVTPRDAWRPPWRALPRTSEVRTFERPHRGYAQYAVCRAPDGLDPPYLQQGMAPSVRGHWVGHWQPAAAGASPTATIA